LTFQVQRCLERLAAGDRAARDELIHCACDRLLRITRKILRDYPDVRRWEQTDDLFQSAVLRLYQSLDKVPVQDARHFFRLAAVQIRRELIDLYRHYYGPQGAGTHHASRPRSSEADSPAPPRLEAAEQTRDPSRLAEWSDFHALVDTLPEEEREVFDLMWYHGLSTEEVAPLLQVDPRTIRRRWRSARLHLHERLQGEAPGT
jgi:RNA polymerase sigma-70 factor (ECF subfamily)